MLVHHLRNAAIDRPAYDACVQAAPNGLVYGLSWWLDVVSPGWEALVLGDYRAVLPLPVKRRYGIRFVDQPLFCPFLGIFSPEPLGEGETTAVFRTLAGRFKLVTRLCLAADAQPPVGDWHLRHTHLLDLSQSYERIFGGYTPDRRQNLKRAQAVGWELHVSHDIQPLSDWFRQFHARNIPGGVAPGTYERLRRLFEETERRGLSTLYYARKDGQPEAGIWLVTYRNRVTYLFNAATPTGRRGNGRTFLLDSFFREKAGTNLLFDFESPGVPSITGFYESFGARPEPYRVLSYNRLPGWVNAAWGLKQRLLKKPIRRNRLF
jgi:hypothetical protein